MTSDRIEQAKTLLATMVEGSKSAFHLALTEEQVQTLAKGFLALADQRDTARQATACAEKAKEQAWGERDGYLVQLSKVAAERDAVQAELDRSTHLLSLDLLAGKERETQLTEQRDLFRKSFRAEQSLFEKANPLVAAPSNADTKAAASIILEEAYRATRADGGVSAVRLTPVAVYALSHAWKAAQDEIAQLKRAYDSEQKRLLGEVARLQVQLGETHDAFADLSELVLEGEGDSAMVSLCVIEPDERALYGGNSPVVSICVIELGERVL